MRTTAYDERWVDVITYSCKHSYWQEKGLNLSEGICDSCLQTWFIEKFGSKDDKIEFNKRDSLVWEIIRLWNKKRVRRFIRG